MKTSSFSNIGAITLAGLALTLGTTANAREHGGHSSGHSTHPGKGHGNSHCSKGHGHGHSCSHLPRGCRKTNYRGESCWYGGGHYYRCNPLGGFVIIDAEPEYETTYVETPVVQRRVIETEVVEEPVVEEEVVSVLPASYETVYVDGESYWYSNGCYYSRCGHGYKKCHGRPHCHGKGSHGNHGKQCKTGHNNGHNNGGHGHGTSHGSHGSHNSGHSSHNSSHGSHGGSKGGKGRH